MRRSRDSGAVARLNVSHDSWQIIWTYVDRVLVLNLGIVLTNAPLLAALAIVAEPWEYPVFFTLLALSVGPSLAAAFGYLRHAELHGRRSLRCFFRAYWKGFRGAALRWAVTLALSVVLLSDIWLLHDSLPGALLVPLLVVLLLHGLATGVHAIALLTLRPDLGHRRGFAVALFGAARCWWLSLITVAVLLVAAVLVNQSPVLGLATVPGCALIVAWSNSRATLARLATPVEQLA